MESRDIMGTRTRVGGGGGGKKTVEYINVPMSRMSPDAQECGRNNRKNVAGRPVIKDA